MFGTIVGAMHKKGSFHNQETGELIDYDNLELTLLVPVKIGGAYDPIEAVGMTTEKKAKCPFNSLSDVFGKEYRTINDLEKLMGKNVEFFYDGSKKLNRVFVNE